MEAKRITERHSIQGPSKGGYYKDGCYSVVRSDGVVIAEVHALPFDESHDARATAITFAASPDLVKAADAVVALNERLKREVSVSITESQPLYDALAAALSKARGA